MRGLILAFGFLTRLPMPALADFKQEEFSSSAVWFPLVGLVIGLCLTLAALFGLSANHWFAALLVLLVWLAITGALHIDGASDMADGLGAAHADSSRLMEVMKDPHVGSFGVVVIVAILVTKLVTVAWMLELDVSLWCLILIPAWARLGSVYWSQSLPALSSGSAEAFTWQVASNKLWWWAAGLFAISLVAVSFWFAAAAVLIIYLWRAYLKWRLGGMSGDCLGAGIEYCECAMLIAVGLI